VHYGEYVYVITYELFDSETRARSNLFSQRVIIRPEAILRGEYWDYFRAQFGGVHVFGYNCAESKPIYMKSGAFRVHCWWLAPADFGRDMPSSDSLGARRFFST